MLNLNTRNQNVIYDGDGPELETNGTESNDTDSMWRIEGGVFNDYAGQIGEEVEEDRTDDERHEDLVNVVYMRYLDAVTQHRFRLRKWQYELLTNDIYTKEKNIFYVSATGSGKSLIYVNLIMQDYMRNPYSIKAYVSPYCMLCDQNYDLLSKVMEGKKEILRVYSDYDEVAVPTKSIWICTPEKLSIVLSKRMERRISLLILDEIHVSLSNRVCSYDFIVSYIKLFCPFCRYVMTTATSNFVLERLIGNVFGTDVFRGEKEREKRTRSVHVEPRHLLTSSVVEAEEMHKRGRKVIIFTMTRYQTTKIFDLLVKHSKYVKEKGVRVFREYRNKPTEYQDGMTTTQLFCLEECRGMMVCTTIIALGVDTVGVDGIIIVGLKRGKEECEEISVIQQMIGRASRPGKGEHVIPEVVLFYVEERERTRFDETVRQMNGEIVTSMEFKISTRTISKQMLRLCCLTDQLFMTSLSRLLEWNLLYQLKRMQCEERKKDYIMFKIYFYVSTSFIVYKGQVDELSRSLILFSVDPLLIPVVKILNDWLYSGMIKKDVFVVSIIYLLSVHFLPSDFDISSYTRVLSIFGDIGLVEEVKERLPDIFLVASRYTVFGSIMMNRNTNDSLLLLITAYRLYGYGITHEISDGLVSIVSDKFNAISHIFHIIATAIHGRTEEMNSCSDEIRRMAFILSLKKNAHIRLVKGINSRKKLYLNMLNMKYDTIDHLLRMSSGNVDDVISVTGANQTKREKYLNAMKEAIQMIKPIK